jgi:hypothetical protein
MNSKLYIIIIVPLFSATITIVCGQSQTKKFFVNAAQFAYSKEPLCEGFEVAIYSNKIELGDDFELEVTNKVHLKEENVTRYIVIDPAKSNKICAINHGTFENGDNFVECFPCNDRGQPSEKRSAIFFYWDYVPYYSLWRYGRNKN